MALITKEPIVLVSANQWEIDGIVINPTQPSISYQVVARLGKDEVRRTTVFAGGDELTNDPKVLQLYRIIEKMLYADAQGKGVIPAEAFEVEPVETPAAEEVSDGTSE